jgi:hypothetical protein
MLTETMSSTKAKRSLWLTLLGFIVVSFLMRLVIG